MEKSFKKLRGEKPGGVNYYFCNYLFIFSYLPGRYIGLKKSARATRRANSLGEFPRELKPRRRRRARRRHHEHPGHARLGGSGIFGLRGAAEPRWAVGRAATVPALGETRPGDLQRQNFGEIWDKKVKERACPGGEHLAEKLPEVLPPGRGRRDRGAAASPSLCVSELPRGSLHQAHEDRRRISGGTRAPKQQPQDKRKAFVLPGSANSLDKGLVLGASRKRRQ